MKLLHTLSELAWQFTKLSKRTPSQQGMLLLQRGEYYFDRHDYTRALDIFEQAHRIFTQIDDSSHQLLTLERIGNTYHELGHRTQTIRAFEAILQQSQALGEDRFARMALINLGTLARYNDQ